MHNMAAWSGKPGNLNTLRTDRELNKDLEQKNDKIKVDLGA